MEKILKVSRGSNGWGGPLYLKNEPGKKIVSMTGNFIDPVAEKIGEMLGLEVINGFKHTPQDTEILCVIINCGGTLRCGIYPKKRVPTINVTPVGKSGPLAEFILEDIYVSDVREGNLELVSGMKENGTAEKRTKDSIEDAVVKKMESMERTEKFSFLRLIEKIGLNIGNVVTLFFQSGKEAVDIMIKTVVPFMAFISVFIAIINSTAIGTTIAKLLTPLSGSIIGLVVLALICGIPFLSPILGPGAAIAQVVGVLIGAKIGVGEISPVFALPALFAINVQVGADFLPVGMSMQEAKPETIEIGTPAVLLSRQLTGPLAVIIAYLIGLGLF